MIITKETAKINEYSFMFNDIENIIKEYGIPFWNLDRIDASTNKNSDKIKLYFRYVHSEIKGFLGSSQKYWEVEVTIFRDKGRDIYVLSTIKYPSCIIPYTIIKNLNESIDLIMDKYFNKRDIDDVLCNFDYRDITFPTYSKAKEMLDKIKSRAGAFGTIYVSEFKELSGLPTQELDSKYGWYKTDLECADVKYTPWKGYIIVLPKPRNIMF